MASNPQASPSVGTTNLEMSDEDNAKRSIEHANDERANKKHRSGIDVMKFGIDVSDLNPSSTTGTSTRVQHGHQDTGRGRPTLGLRKGDAKPRRKIADETPVRLDPQRHVQRREHHDECNLEEDRAGRDGEAHEPGQNASGLCVCLAPDATPSLHALRAQTSETGKFVERDVHQGGGSQNQRGVHQLGPASVRLEPGDEWRGGASKEEHHSRATCFCPGAPKQNDAPTYPEKFCEELVKAIREFS